MLQKPMYVYTFITIYTITTDITDMKQCHTQSLDDGDTNRNYQSTI